MLRLQITMQRCKSAIYDPILMKFGLQTENNLMSPKTQLRRSDAILQVGRRHVENRPPAMEGAITA
jgi:hypothetical protein